VKSLALSLGSRFSILHSPGVISAELAYGALWELVWGSISICRCSIVFRFVSGILIAVQIVLKLRSTRFPPTSCNLGWAGRWAVGLIKCGGVLAVDLR